MIWASHNPPSGTQRRDVRPSRRPFAPRDPPVGCTDGHGRLDESFPVSGLGSAPTTTRSRLGGANASVQHLPACESHTVSVELAAYPVATRLVALCLTRRKTAAVEVPPISYTRSGDVAIAYQVLGDGPVDLVFVPELSNLIWYWQHPLPAGFFRELASFSRLILLDKRGVGLSDRPRDLGPLETRMDDIRAVLDAVGSERAALFGLHVDGPFVRPVSLRPTRSGRRP